MGPAGQAFSLWDLGAGQPAVLTAQTTREACGTGRQRQPLVSQPCNDPRQALVSQQHRAGALQPRHKDPRHPAAVLLAAGPTLRWAARGGHGQQSGRDAAGRRAGLRAGRRAAGAGAARREGGGGRAAAR